MFAFVEMAITKQQEEEEKKKRSGSVIIANGRRPTAKVGNSVVLKHSKYSYKCLCVCGELGVEI